MTGVDRLRAQVEGGTSTNMVVPRALMRDILYEIEGEVAVRPTEEPGETEERAKECCDRCRWWDPMEDYDEVRRRGAGFCNRFPPLMVMCPAGDPEMPSTFQPEVGCAFCCGEFEAAR